MAFTDFKSIAQVQQTFNITYIEEDYAKCDGSEPSNAFLDEFNFSKKNIDIFSSEASRCENVIYPMIRDVYKNYASQYSLWSHKLLSYNDILTGIPDYLLTTKSRLGKTILGMPIMIVVEAKQHNFTEGWGQCLAELVAAQKLNENANIPVHGIVTDAEIWHFGKLIADVFVKNEAVFAISDLNKVFGTISYVIKSSQQYLV